MAVTETMRPTQTGGSQVLTGQVEALQPGSPTASLGASPGAMPQETVLRTFQQGRAEEHRLDDLLAFALAVDKRHPATPETVERMRHEAAAALSGHAFRYLHNSIEQIRREAVAEELGRVRKPPGFVALVMANLVALALAGGLAGWLALHPETLAGLAGLFTG